jgi:hypothetical protein
MGRCLLDEVISQIKLRLNLDEKILYIVRALKVLRDVIYKIQLNFDFWGQLYVPPSIKLGRLSTLLEYQKLVYNPWHSVKCLLILLYKGCLSFLKINLQHI